MAASANPINGTDVIFQISEDSGSTWDTVGFCTSCSFGGTMDPRDTTNKDSGGNRALGSGKKSFNYSAEGLVTYSTVTDVDKPNDLFTLFNNRTQHHVRFGSLTTGEYEYTSAAFLTSYNQEAGTEDNNTFSASWEATGAVTQAAVS